MASILVCTRREDLLVELGPLLRSQHQVAIVPHVADVVRSLLLTRTDAVILDIDDEMAQHVDILPVAARLNPRIPLLTVSDPISLEVEAAVRAAGIYALLVRPLSPGELERHLAAALFWRITRGWASASANDAKPAAAAR
jgi:AmiR/NasT family two-component response regulator